MGSLTSRPNIPQAQQPVVVTVPAAAPAPATQNAATASPAASTAAPVKANEETPAADTASDTPVSEAAQREAREQSLLRRSRGRFGTVLTGFTGLLSQTSGQSGRKTLLGE